MQTTSEILKALAPEFVALDEAEKSATPLNFNSAESKEEFTYVCPLCEGSGEVEARQYFNFDNLALNMCFSGRGEAIDKDQRFVNEARSKTRALLDAHAQALAQIAELKSKLESQIRWQEQAILNCTQKDCANSERNLKWYQASYYRALRALAKLAEQEWQPIETAAQEYNA